MIIETNASVTFPTGTMLSGAFQPQSGLTAVVGPNEVGKTFRTIEVTRYLLFGRKALRGAATDYKTLEADGRFIIRGSEYKIERTKKHTRITDASGSVLAVGKDELNKKVVELLGYGLQVFDICNASVQKKADIFGKMKPAERKRMIDEVVGLTSNETVEKACRDEAKGLKREVDALLRNLRPPEEPVQPDNYRRSEDVKTQLVEDRNHKARYEQLEASIKSFPTPDVPEAPRPAAGEIARLQAHQAEYGVVSAQRQNLEVTIGRAPEQAVPYTHLELHAARDRLGASALVTCPNCDHRFRTEDIPDGPDLTITQIQTYERALLAEQEAQFARVQLAKLPVMENLNDDLWSLKEAEQEWMSYDRAVARLEAQEEANETARASMSRMSAPVSQAVLDALQDELVASQVYEAARERYDTDKLLYETLTAEIAEKQRMAEEYTKGGQALADARATLKAYLAPSLSRVASALIRDMTHGKHESIIVDEDMEITVSGQRIETLSGGAETVANIALRIALGRVLVSSTFPVFLGDEMDGDADDVRREAVLEALVSLKEHLSQIILITHRGADVADHVIDFGYTG